MGNASQGPRRHECTVHHRVLAAAGAFSRAQSADAEPGGTKLADLVEGSLFFFAALRVRVREAAATRQQPETSLATTGESVRSPATTGESETYPATTGESGRGPATTGETGRGLATKGESGRGSATDGGGEAASLVPAGSVSVVSVSAADWAAVCAVCATLDLSFAELLRARNAGKPQLTVLRWLPRPVGGAFCCVHLQTVRPEIQRADIQSADSQRSLLGGGSEWARQTVRSDSQHLRSLYFRSALATPLDGGAWGQLAQLCVREGEPLGALLHAASALGAAEATATAAKAAALGSPGDIRMATALASALLTLRERRAKLAAIVPRRPPAADTALSLVEATARARKGGRQLAESDEAGRRARLLAETASLLRGLLLATDESQHDRNDETAANDGGDSAVNEEEEEEGAL
mmetsp:Transcript_1067/g.2748  ORF Transcript_1067/g.2748 Transcript_1067/m.2748 type:complete len:410 (+) Transcript_1067:434-1663(+)